MSILKYKDQEQWRDLILDAVYPVGSLYFSYSSTSPSKLLGGTWVQITGKFLRANNDTGTGGADTVTLTVDQIPSHRHMPYQSTKARFLERLTSEGAAEIAAADYYFSSNGNTSSNWGKWELYTAMTGGGKAHNNMPAYQDIYVWRRTA